MCMVLVHLQSLTAIVNGFARKVSFIRWHRIEIESAVNDMNSYRRYQTDRRTDGKSSFRTFQTLQSREMSVHDWATLQDVFYRYSA